MKKISPAREVKGTSFRASFEISSNRLVAKLSRGEKESQQCYTRDAKGFKWLSEHLLYFVTTEWIIWFAFQLIPEIAFKEVVMKVVAFAAALNFLSPIMAHTIVNICKVVRYTKTQCWERSNETE